MPYTQPVSDVRTQIYLSYHLHAKISELAEQRGVSLAQIIREALIKDIGDDTYTSNDAVWKKFFRVAGIGKNGPRDVSSKTGEYWAQAIEKKLKRRKTL